MVAVTSSNHAAEIDVGNDHVVLTPTAGPGDAEAYVVDGVRALPGRYTGPDGYEISLLGEPAAPVDSYPDTA